MAERYGQKVTTGSAGVSPASPGRESSPAELIMSRDPDLPVKDVAIRVRNLRKVYGEIEAVRGIDLDVRVGEIFGLIGPDGAGKTSVFQILGGVMQEIGRAHV